MRNIAEDGYANTCNWARTHKRTLTRAKTKSRHTSCTGRPGPNPIKKHLHAHTGTQTHLSCFCADWEGNSNIPQVLFPRKYPEQSTFASEPTPITITGHICHINFVHHEIYCFSKKPLFIYSAGQMQQSWHMVRCGRSLQKVESSVLIFLSVSKLYGPFQ